MTKKLLLLKIISVLQVIFITGCITYVHFETLGIEGEIESNRFKIQELYNYNEDNLNDTELENEADKIHSNIEYLHSTKPSRIPELLLIIIWVSSIMLLWYIILYDMDR